MILLLDNYDSFTYNIAQYAWELGADLEIYRNDKITLHEIEQMRPKGIIISPGPGRPEEAGISIELIRFFSSKTPILGVCLGHQAIGYAFGGKIVYAPTILHGKISSIHWSAFCETSPRFSSLFTGMQEPFTATRYHSLVISPEDFPSGQLAITAETPDNIIMAVQHREYPVYGVQFHPESILTQDGQRIIANFLSVCEKYINDGK